MIDPSSPWWPLAVAQVLANGKPPGAYPVPYQHWLLWHRDCVLAGKVPGPIPGDVAFVQVALAAVERPLPA